MSTTGNIFERTLSEFIKNSLTAQEKLDFQFTTLDDVRITALNIQNSRDTTKTLMNMARLNSFLEATNQFGKVIDVFGNTSTFVAFIWGPLKFILQVASTWADSFEFILDAYYQIGENMPLFEQYQHLFGRNPYMERVLISIYTGILEFHKKAISMFRGKREVWRLLFRSIWKNYETKFKWMLEGFKKHKEFLTEQAQLLHFEESRTNNEAVSTYITKYEAERSQELARLVVQKQNEEDRQYYEILGWLSAADSITDVHDDLCRKRAAYKGTGNWFLAHEKVDEWRNSDPPSKSILWVNGIPGAGKTILASVIIESCLKDNSRTTSYFYCSESGEKRNDCISIYRGLLSQLLNQFRELVPYCWDKRKSSGEVILTSRNIAERLLEIFAERIPKQFVLIDGLDECNPDERKQVFSFFSTVVEKCDASHPGKLRVLFLSQDFPDIAKALPTADVMRMSAKDNENDIKIYIDHEAGKIKGKHSLNDDGIKFIQEATLARSRGMFLFAKLVMENLYAQETQRDLQKEIKDFFPDGLSDAYERILLRLKKNLAPNQWNIVRRLLGWLVCAKRSLKWREIQAAISMDPDEQEFDFKGRSLKSSIEDYCGSLIQVLSKDRVELVHTTVKKYFMESTYICPSAVECDLAALCLRYLTFDCFDDDDEVGDEELQSLAIQGWLSFQDYATAKWHDHIRAIIAQLQFSASDGLQDELDIAIEGLEIGLDEFATRYQQEVTKTPVLKESENDCERFKTHPFHTNILYVLNHIRQYYLKSQEARKELSLDPLNKALLRNRKILETLASDQDNSDKLVTFYGDKHFKCPRPTCFYFHEGFQDKRLRDEHINKHDRPFSCAVPDCSIAEFGYSSNKELEKHTRLFHPELTDQSEVFASKKQITAATPWECELCHKRFTRGFHKKNHLRSHTGEKPYQCQQCGKAFTRANDCRRHEKTVCARDNLRRIS